MARRWTRLTPDTIDAIRRMRFTEGKGYLEIRNALGVSNGTIARYTLARKRKAKRQKNLIPAEPKYAILDSKQFTKAEIEKLASIGLKSIMQKIF